MGKLLDKICEAMALVAALLMIFATFSIGYTILARVSPLPSALWVVQFNEYILLWMTFLATAWVLSNNKHVSVGIIFDNLSAKGQRWMVMFHNLTGLFICGLLTWYGTLTTWDQYRRGVLEIQVVDFPVAYVIFAIPLGFLLLTLQFARKLANGIFYSGNQEAPPLKSATHEELPGDERVTGRTAERTN